MSSVEKEAKELRAFALTPLSRILGEGLGVGAVFGSLTNQVVRNVSG